jgi:hypothetical protein
MKYSRPGSWQDGVSGADIWLNTTALKKLGNSGKAAETVLLIDYKRRMDR